MTHLYRCDVCDEDHDAHDLRDIVVDEINDLMADLADTSKLAYEAYGISVASTLENARLALAIAKSACERAAA